MKTKDNNGRSRTCTSTYTRQTLMNIKLPPGKRELSNEIRAKATA